MSFKTSLVDIDKITSKVKRSTFSEDKLEELANLILELNGTIQPLVVQETSLEKYEVVEGDFQFYGALKAWEIDDDFEMIRAFIVDEKEHNLVSQQLQLLQSLTKDPVIIKPDNNQARRIDNLEDRLNKFRESSEANLEKKIKALELEINQLSKQLPTKLDVLTTFNELELKKLVLPLQTAGFTDKKINSIISFINQERKKRPFESLAEIVDRSKVKQGKRQVRLITEAKLIEIIDRWSKIAFY